jgi:hypothetical protein
MADMTLSAYGRAICAGCDQEKSLRRDGNIRHHLVPTANRYASNVCAGAGKAPKTAREES